ncbi:MAG TPA: 50S ribosomal protein L18 [Terriglobales bacterium]|nr:50S ribosomal protein L18 [Terriglobales bacterium]
MLKNKIVAKRVRDDRLRKRIRERVKGTPERPRVHVFKSNTYLYTQVINDAAGTVLLTASTLEKALQEKSKNGKNKKASALLGQVLAERLKAKNIGRVVFDRGVYPYHGRVKTLADAMRKAGIEF